MIYDVAGFPAIRGQELIDNLVEQASQYDPLYILNHRAEDLVAEDDGTFTIRTHRGTEVDTKAVLITGGIGTFTPRPLPDAEEFEGRGLVYFVPKLDVMQDKDVLIVGGGDSAFDWATNLEGIARSITLIHRRDRFRAHEHTVNQVLASSVQVAGVLMDLGTGPGGSVQVASFNVLNYFLTLDEGPAICGADQQQDQPGKHCKRPGLSFSRQIFISQSIKDCIEHWKHDAPKIIDRRA